jgi:hypothetical protein
MWCEEPAGTTPAPISSVPARNVAVSSVPAWFHGLSVASLLLGGFCLLVIVLDLLKHPQHMWIMNIVWAVTALFGSLWIVWQYFRYGRLAERRVVQQSMQRGEDPPNKRLTPFPIAVANGALHCGSGCTLGDIMAEWLMVAFPAIAIAFGYKSIFSQEIFARWVVGYFFAYAVGVLFQYFTIAPMRGLSVSKGIVAAIKADTLSLTAWQFGMYGFMAIAHFAVFQIAFGAKLESSSPEFWFMMQIGMICGFLTSYPVNWWLIRSGLKEKM